MGPKCPECGEVHELVESDIREHVYFPKIQSCYKCYHVWTLTVEEYQAIQSAAAVFYKIANPGGDNDGS